MKINRSLRIPENVHAALVKQSHGSVSAEIGRIVAEYTRGTKTTAVLGKAKTTSILIDHTDMERVCQIADKVGVSANELLVRMVTDEVRGTLEEAGSGE